MSVWVQAYLLTVIGVCWELLGATVIYSVLKNFIQGNEFPKEGGNQ